jgi:murein L,D-transpeptidase YafK
MRIMLQKILGFNYFSLVVLRLFITLLCYANLPNAWFGEQKPIDPDNIVVHKSARQLKLLKDGAVIRTYEISLGFTPIGDKVIEGDGKTPEGSYIIDAKNPNSMAHLSLHISYPNAEQVANAKVVDQDPGGMIMIHGIKNGLGWIGRFHRYLDWTNGCIAVTNQEMDEIYEAVSIGTAIQILP